MNSNLIKLAIGNLKSILTAQLFMSTGIDMTNPIHLLAKINSDCNSRCIMCHNWRPDEPSSFSWIYRTKKRDLPADIYNKAFKALKEIQPNIKISFTGGEVLLKDDIYEIFEFCNFHQINYGFVTNAIELTETRVNEILKLNPSIIHISLDSLDSEIYKRIRGVSRLDRVLENIDILLAHIKKSSCSTLVCLKTIVCKDNVNELARIALYAEEKGFNGITFQPVFKTTREALEMFEINMHDLSKTVDTLVNMKKQRYKILNSESNMIEWLDYFNGIFSDSGSQCPVPVKNLYVFDNGDIKLCEFDEEIIGNIERDSIKDVLNSDKTRQLKKSLINCKKPCNYCIKRSLKDYVDIALTVMNIRKRRHNYSVH